MQYEKKQIVKEDGRYLIYYHFPATAGLEQSAAFAKAEELAADPLFTTSSGEPVRPSETDSTAQEDVKLV